MSTRCRTIQVLEAEPAAAMEVLDASDPAVYEEGALALTPNVAQYNIMFAALKLATTYDFEEAEIENTEDPDPLVLTYTILERRVDGFIVEFSALPDSANYRFNWSVKVNTI